MKTKIRSALLIVILSVSIKNLNAQLTADWFAHIPEMNNSAGYFMKMYHDNSNNIFILTRVSLTKFDSNGSQLWALDQWSVSDGSFIYDMILDATGNAYVTFVTDYNGYVSKVHLVKYNVFGNVEWEQILSDASGYFVGGELGIDLSGNIILSCNYLNLTGWHLYVTKYNSSGNQQWSYITTDNAGVYGMAIDQYGNNYTAYLTSSHSYYLLKLDGGGIFQFSTLICTPTGAGGGLLGLVYDQGSSSLFTHISCYPGDHIFERIDAANGNILWSDTIFTYNSLATDCRLDGLGNVYFSIGYGNVMLAKKYSTTGIFQFDFPYGTGYDIDGSGNLYVMEPYSNMIKKYSSAGNQLWSYSDPSHLIWTSAAGLENVPMILDFNNKLYAIATDYISIGLVKYTQCNLPSISITAGGATTFCDGGNVKLTSVASIGSAYQWQKDAVNIAGATKKNYTAKAAGTYACVAINGCGPQNSNSIDITVLSVPVSKVKNISPVNMCEDETETLNAKTCYSCTYQWQKNGVSISNATNSSYDTNVEGSYTVITTNSSNCSKTSKPCLVAITCKESDIAKGSFTFLPNPSNGIFTLSLFIPENEKVEMGIYNVTGNLVKLLDPVNGIGEMVVEVNADDLASGTYFVKAMTSKEVIVRKIEIVR